MVRVKIFAGEDDEPVGEFEFDQLPRQGEEVTVPWPADLHGLRIFTVGEVSHYAAGASGPWGEGPLTVLRYAAEIT